MHRTSLKLKYLHKVLTRFIYSIPLIFRAKMNTLKVSTAKLNISMHRLFYTGTL